MFGTVSAVATMTDLPPAPASTSRGLRIAGLFAGIGGLELGMHRVGHHASLLCEIDTAAQTVLRARFPAVEVVDDIRNVDQLPDVDVVAAGFPCQDLSQAGNTVGIAGSRSGLVGHVFRLLEAADPTWLVLENVPFMLQLDRGRAMRHLTNELGRLGFRWAYRVVDARAFGLPQRRQRVLLVASRREDPCRVLFADDVGQPPEQDHRGRANGFYWTEGIRGLGWAADGVPTLKGGSTIGIPSPPAVWMPDGSVGTPHIRDAERLQGFEAGWTEPAARTGMRGLGARWKMVGNAVSVPVAAWVAGRLSDPGRYRPGIEVPLTDGRTWPRAAHGQRDEAVSVDISMWPMRHPYQHLSEFLSEPLTPLSVRAADGFLARTERGSLRFPEGLLDAVRSQATSMRGARAA
jgi:DNA (cytosine-5)-methyltransferase 1